MPPRPPRPDRATVIKKLAPGAPGTRSHLVRHGADLVCVRYREYTDAAGATRRLTTVELVVDDRPAARREALVHVAYRETELRGRVKQAGGVWDQTRKLWRVPATAVKALGLEDRIVREDA